MNNALLKDGDTICERKFGKKGRCTEIRFHPACEAFDRVQLLLPSGTHVLTHENEFWVREQFRTATFNSALKNGRDYMAGRDCPMKDFLKSSTTYINRNHWLYYAVLWAIENPTKALTINGPRMDHTVAMRGEYVEICLPHHGRGGEKCWIVDPKTPNKKILVDVD